MLSNDVVAMPIFTFLQCTLFALRSSFIILNTDLCTASTSGLMNFSRREYIIFSNFWYKNEDNGLSDWKNFRKGSMIQATYWKKWYSNWHQNVIYRNFKHYLQWRYWVVLNFEHISECFDRYPKLSVLVLHFPPI